MRYLSSQMTGFVHSFGVQEIRVNNRSRIPEGCADAMSCHLSTSNKDSHRPLAIYETISPYNKLRWASHPKCFQCALTSGLSLKISINALVQRYMSKFGALEVWTHNHEHLITILGGLDHRKPKTSPKHSACCRGIVQSA